jgi:hypothetical protein
MRVNEFIRQAEAEGWAATLCPGGHWRLDHAEATAPVYFAATPSDWRWHLNTRTEMRRVLPPRPKPVRAIEPRPKRRPPAHRPEPVRDFGGPITMLRTPPPPQPIRRVYEPEPRSPPRLAGGPSGWVTTRWQR